MPHPTDDPTAPRCADRRSPLSTNTRVIHATPDKVWEVLSDGWLYPLWVVGATRMRGVEGHWPEVGARLHHSVGVWPIVANDDTVSLECDPSRRLRLRAKGWPLGEANVALELEPHDEGTLVRLHEDAVKGPGLLIWKPIRQQMLTVRNVESLRRLAFLVEGRA